MSTILNVDSISAMSDDEITNSIMKLEEQKKSLKNPKQVEMDIAYLQREFFYRQQIRRRNNNNHNSNT